MLLFIIGPSGVGKTTLIKKSQKKLPAIVHVDVDYFIKTKHPDLYNNAATRWRDFWLKSLECFEENEQKYGSSDTLCLLDIGAGSLQTEAALPFFSKIENTLLIEDKPESVFRRNIHRTQKTQVVFKEFKATEYSKNRKKIYKTCRYRLRLTDLTPDTVLEEFIKICGSVVA